MRPARSLGRPEPPSNESPRPKGAAGGEVNTGASKSFGASAQKRHAAFWATMERCKSIDALEREFLREAHLKHGAPRSTVEALMLSLRERGYAALDETGTQRRVCDLSPDQIADCIERIDNLRDRYPDADRLISKLGEIIE